MSYIPVKETGKSRRAEKITIGSVRREYMNAESGPLFLQAHNVQVLLAIDKILGNPLQVLTPYLRWYGYR